MRPVSVNDYQSRHAASCFVDRRHHLVSWDCGNTSATVCRPQRAVTEPIDREEAADLTQTTFLKAYEQLASFDQTHKFFSWLYRIAINESINHIKRHRRVEP